MHCPACGATVQTFRNPVPTVDIIIETAGGREAVKEFLPMQAGDVKDTYADISAIQRDLGYEPTTTIDDGVPRFVDWFRRYHGV